MTVKFSILLLTLFSFQMFALSQQTYHLDTGKSRIGWSSGEIGHHFGYIKFSSGNLLFSATGEPVSGTFVVDMKTIKSTDNKVEAKNLKTDAAMTNPDFFNVPKYPEARIVVTEIAKLNNPDHYQVRGNLTMKGITAPIGFTAAIVHGKNTVNIGADIALDRSWWGIDSKPTMPSLDFVSGASGKVMKHKIFVSLKLLMTK